MKKKPEIIKVEFVGGGGDDWLVYAIMIVAGFFMLKTLISS
jgi:hypothetical protein